MLEGFFQCSVVWVVLAAGLDDVGAELLFHLAGRRFVLEILNTWLDSTLG
jgi:hypothetical protein